MDVGVGLPMKSLLGDELAEFATAVEAGPFSSISLGQRLTFDTNDPMIALTYVAALTGRIRLMTSILCLPFHKEGVVAQQAATLDRLSQGRFSLGLGLGGRESDFAVSPTPWEHRGQRFEEQLVMMRRCWNGEPAFEGTEGVGPTPLTPGGPEVIIGAYATKALERTGRLADGLRSFSFSTDVTEHLDRFAVVQAAWDEAGRAGRPRLVTATHFALGPGARETYEAHIAKYYGYQPSLVAEAMAGNAPTSPEAIQATIRRFADAGVDELIFTATTADTMDSLHRLAEVVAGV